MAQCDAMLLGREPVEGAVHAASLASLVRGMAGTKARPNRQGEYAGPKGCKLSCIDDYKD